LGKFDKHKLKNRDRLKNVQKESKDVFSASEKKLYSIDIEKIVPNPYQPRMEIDSVDDLKKSIEKIGLIQPLTVSKNSDNTYTLIYGHRRLQALKELGRSDVEVLIESNDDKNLRLKAIAENAQRKDLDFLELAVAFKEVQDEHDLTNEELAKEVNKSTTYISQVLSILKLNDELIKKIKDENYKTLSVLNKLNQVESEKQVEIYDTVKSLTRDEALKYIDVYKKSLIKPKEIKAYEIKAKNGKYKIDIDTNKLDHKSKVEVLRRLNNLIMQIEGKEIKKPKF
jgi:ParB family chromosome partitioning protein